VRRLLYVTSNFLPAGGAAVLRALKTVKYLPDFGWRATVVTADAPSDIHRDETLEAPAGLEIVRVPSPLAFLRRRRGGGNNGAAGPRGVRARLRAAIIREALVPDSEAPWSLAAAHAIQRAIKGGRVDAVLSTSPVPSNHVAVRLALGRHRGRRLPWLVDVRDPWIDARGITGPNRSWTLLDRALERACLGSVDGFATVNEPLLELYLARYPQLATRPHAVVRNGFDPDDFEGEPAPLEGELASLGSRFDLVFTGRFYGGRTPEQGLAEALGELGRARPDFARDARLFLVGPRDPVYEPDLSRAAPVPVVRHGAVAYRLSIACQRRASLLVLLGGDFAAATTLKVYEYLAARRPIIAQATRGSELEKLLAGRPGVLFAPLEGGARALVPLLAEAYDAWSSGRLAPREDPGLDAFSRRTQTGMIADLLDEIVRAHHMPGDPSLASPVA